MPAGFKWVRVLLTDKVCRDARKNRSGLSWDAYITKLINQDTERHSPEAIAQGERLEASLEQVTQAVLKEAGVKLAAPEEPTWKPTGWEHPSEGAVHHSDLKADITLAEAVPVAPESPPVATEDTEMQALLDGLP